MDMVDRDKVSVVTWLRIYIKSSTPSKNMTLLWATATIVHVMGLWCAGHFHIHCSEEASLLEYPLMVSNASSELKSDHVRQLFVLLCEYMGFCLGFCFFAY